MLRTSLSLAHKDLRTTMMPRLIGRVFHVTCASNLPAIEKAGHVDVNTDGRYETAFGSSSNSFFRNRACVSVFDYRSVTAENLEDSLLKCSPFQAGRRCGWKLAFFILDDQGIGLLRSWREWKGSESWSEMVVPYVEAGHPGPIPLSSVEELLDVLIEYEPSAFELAMETSRDRDESR